MHLISKRLKRLDSLFSTIALYIYEYDNGTENSFLFSTPCTWS